MVDPLQVLFENLHKLYFCLKNTLILSNKMVKNYVEPSKLVINFYSDTDQEQSWVRRCQQRSPTQTDSDN